MFWIGLILTIVLWVRQVKAALIISILGTTLIALAAGVAKLPTDLAQLVMTPSFTTLGQVDPFEIFTIPTISLLAAILIIFSIMLTDFFDTMGTVTGVAAEAGLANEDGTVPGVGRILLVDSVAAAVGGLGGVSSNTTYIESAAGVAEGGRTGFASIVTGVLFLLAILLAPIAGIIPGVATAPALVLVGYLMFTQVKDIDVTNVEDGIPALLTMILMPLTYDIALGIGAGFASWVLIKVVRGKAREVHLLMWIVAILFIVFFLQDWIIAFGQPAPTDVAIGPFQPAHDRRLRPRGGPPVARFRATIHRMFHRTELPQGPRVISARLPGSRSVSIAAYVLAGSRLERPGQAGVAHFMEHLTFKGTAGLPDQPRHLGGRRGRRWIRERGHRPRVDRLLGPRAAPRGDDRDAGPGRADRPAPARGRGHRPGADGDRGGDPLLPRRPVRVRPDAHPAGAVRGWGAGPRDLR